MAFAKKWSCIADEGFIPLSEEEMRDFEDLVALSLEEGDINQAEAANMLLHEAWVNGQFEA